MPRKPKCPTCLGIGYLIEASTGEAPCAWIVCDACGNAGGSPEPRPIPAALPSPPSPERARSGGAALAERIGHVLREHGDPQGYAASYEAAARRLRS